VQTECLWVPVRLIALRLTPEQQRKAERRVHKKAGQDKRKEVKPETLYLAGWLLVVTTLPREQWNEAEVLTLYRSRWHIELLFKRFKQLLHAHRVRCTHAGRDQASLLTLLLAWSL
jgi:DDE family transposase